MMKTKNKSMLEAARELNISRRKLFSLLRENNIIIGTLINDKIKPTGYFIEHIIMVRRGFLEKPVNLINITPRGMLWLKEIIDKLNKDTVDGK